MKNFFGREKNDLLNDFQRRFCAIFFCLRHSAPFSLVAIFVSIRNRVTLHTDNVCCFFVSLSPSFMSFSSFVYATIAVLLHWLHLNSSENHCFFFLCFVPIFITFCELFVFFVFDLLEWNKIIFSENWTSKQHSLVADYFIPSSQLH